jgi:ketosteroid isomerase-like protein
MATEQGSVLVERLVRAVNDHDIEALVACFAEDYVNETPAHPARSFRGREQVRRNWEQIFTFVPDVHASVVRCTTDGPVIWTEWEMTGTRRDGSPHLVRGVVVFGATGGRFDSARFYLEPVDNTLATVDDAIRDQVVRP